MEIIEAEKKREFETVLPLVNIVFLLLIFFMLAGTFTKPDMFNVTLPEASVDSSANGDDITILMNENNELAIEKIRYSKSELLTFIQNKLADKEVGVQLKADENVKSQDLISIIEVLGETSLQSIKILTVISKHTEQ